MVTKVDKCSKCFTMNNNDCVPVNGKHLSPELRIEIDTHCKSWTRGRAEPASMMKVLKESCIAMLRNTIEEYSKTRESDDESRRTNSGSAPASTIACCPTEL
jgi:hypothetical protein